MRIRIRLRINTILTVAAGILIVTSVAVASRVIGHDLRDSRFYTRLLDQAFTLNILADTRDASSMPRAREQWRSVYDSMGSTISMLTPTGGEEQRLFNRILHLYSDIGFLSGQLYSEKPPANPRLADERRAMVMQQLWYKLRALTDSTHRLMDLNEASLNASYRSISIIVFSLVAGFILFNVVLAAILNSSIADSLAALAQAADAVSGENLDYRIPVDTSDEIGNLAKSFNSMAASLQASYGRLREEVEEHKRTEVALRRARDELETRVAERTSELSIKNEVLTREIEERDRAREALRKSESLLQRVLEAMPVGVWIADRTGRLVSVNKTARDFWGETGQLERSDYGRFKGWRHGTGEPVGPDDWPLARAVDKGETVLDEVLEVESPDGRRRVVSISALPVLDEKGRIISAIAVNVDITDRIAAEQTLFRREQEFRALAENAPDIIARYDRDLRYLYINPAIEGVKGIPASTLVGKKVGSRMSDDLRHRFEQALGRVFETGTEQSLDWEYWTAAGFRYFETRLTPEFSTTGQVDSVLEVAHDISRMRRLEDDLRKAKEEAERASQAKSEFLASMSHEIRTPMNGVLGMTELALMADPNPVVREYLMMVRQSGLSLLGIINDILDLSKIEAGKLRLARSDFEIRHLVVTLVRTMSVAARERGLDLDYHIDEDVPIYLNGDKGRLQQVLTNLIANAIKYTPKGRIDVYAGLDRTGPWTEGRVRLLFEVRDTGVGIPRDKYDAIFESFVQLGYQPASRYGGTGLGLPISRSLARLMGGDIKVESELGKGSRFIFMAEFFPAEQKAIEAREAPAAQAPIPQDGQKPDWSGRQVLLVEDNPINQVFAATLLKRKGLEVSVASNGKEALDMLAARPFDLVLMDARMPEMDGEAATRAIRSGRISGIDPKVPVVAVTASAIKGDRERFLAAGMDDYLSKPIDLGELDRILKRILEGQGPAPGH